MSTLRMARRVMRRRSAGRPGTNYRDAKCAQEWAFTARSRGVPQRHPGCANRILAHGGENQETSRTIHVCPDTSVFDKARLRTIWRPPTEIKKGTMYRAPTGKKDPEHDPT